MPRVIAGHFKGLKLISPAGNSTRPTADQVKEAIFSMLTSLSFDCEGARVLDCFAGSGALAIEALSRGAAGATLVDASRQAALAIERNLAGCKPRADAVTFRARWPQALEKVSGRAPFTLFFLDPPYENFSLPLALLRAFAEKGLAQPGAALVWEQAPATLAVWSEADVLPWRLLKTRVKGGQALAFLELEDA